jgi:hypothetical protein
MVAPAAPVLRNPEGRVMAACPLSKPIDDRLLRGVPPWGALERARKEIGLPLLHLWLRYSALGGEATIAEVEAVLAGVLVPSDDDHDLLAVALNERFAELGRDRPLTSRSGGHVEATRRS